jgi:hypothetical protein
VLIWKKMGVAAICDATAGRCTESIRYREGRRDNDRSIQIAMSVAVILLLIDLIEKPIKRIPIGICMLAGSLNY